MKILITGATGFTGGYLSRRLVSFGHQVRALVRSENAIAELESEGIEPVVGELTSPSDVKRAVKDCDQVFHLAAVFRTAGHTDRHYMEVNLGGTKNILDAARQYGCERVVHCSTGGVHGHVAHPPANEDSLIAPGDIYQRSKVAAEQAVFAEVKAGLPAVIVRPGAIYGEGDSRFLKLFQLIQRGRFLMVGRGTARLHLIHVDDLVNGLVLCGQPKSPVGSAFLMAGPEAPTLWEIVRIISGILRVPEPRRSVPVWPVWLAGALCELLCRPLGVDPPLHRRRVSFFTHHREFDISRARSLLDFNPSIGVHHGLERTIQWSVQQGLLSPI